jgi:hypothetical protein
MEAFGRISEGASQKGLKGRSDAVRGNWTAAAHGAVRRDTCALHGGDDLGAVSALRGDAAIGEAAAEFGRAIGNELGGRPSPLAGASCAYGSRLHHVESSTPNRGVFSGRPSFAE